MLVLYVIVQNAWNERNRWYDNIKCLQMLVLNVIVQNALIKMKNKITLFQIFDYECDK